MCYKKYGFGIGHSFEMNAADSFWDKEDKITDGIRSFEIRMPSIFCVDMHMPDPDGTGLLH